MILFDTRLLKTVFPSVVDNYNCYCPMQLSAIFDSVAPREDAGPRSSDRTHYQKDWALCKILDLHSGREDYLVAFDVHDDVLVFEPESDPTTVSFYQIKTRDTDGWTVAAITYRKRKKDSVILLSILGKLYYDYVLFGTKTKRLALVSNATFKLDIATNRKSCALQKPQTPFRDLPTANRAKIIKAIREEHALSSDPDLDDLLWFEKSMLPLDGHHIFAKGRLAEFLAAWNPGGKYNANLIYQALIEEIRRRNDHPSGGITFTELKQNKAIGKTEFEQMLRTAAVDDSAEQTLNALLAELQQEGVDSPNRSRLRRAWQKVETYRSEMSDASFRRLIQVVTQLPIDELPTLSATIEGSVSKLRARPGVSPLFDDDFLKALVLMKYRGIV